MKKSTLIVIISLIVAIILFISGVMLDGLTELKNAYHQDDLNISLPFVKTKDVKRQFENIKNLDIEASTGNFEIVEYSGDVIEIKAENISRRTEVYQDDETLVFKENFRFGFPIVNDTDVKIYVPKDYRFNKVEIEIDAASVKLANLIADELEVDVDAGSFKADNITVEKAVVDVDAGEAKIDLLDSKKSEFNVDVGDIKVVMTGTESDYSYDVDCDLGDIQVGSYRGEGLSDEYYYNGGDRMIEADCNVGNIIIKMEV